MPKPHVLLTAAPARTPSSGCCFTAPAGTPAPPDPQVCMTAGGACSHAPAPGTGPSPASDVCSGSGSGAGGGPWLYPAGASASSRALVALSREVVAAGALCCGCSVAGIMPTPC